jgi:hypothetical protein
MDDINPVQTLELANLPYDPREKESARRWKSEPSR